MVQIVTSMEIFPVESMVDEIEKYVDMSLDESENSSEEELGLTTLTYDLRPETNPPVIIPTASTTEELLTSSIMSKLIGADSTELPFEMVAESSETTKENSELFLKKTVSKSIKARLLDTTRDEVLSKPEQQDVETIESLMEETTIADIDSEKNDTIDSSEEATTIQPPTSKKPKKIEIYKTRPNELLRHYVEDSHLRSPIAALIDKKSNPLMKAKKLWKAALRPNSLLDIMVVSYDSEGKNSSFLLNFFLSLFQVSSGIKSTYNLTNTKAMIATLDRVREENVTTQESKTYYSIIRTGQLIPYDSAIFLSTDNLPNDTEHQQPASMILLKKRIRVRSRTKK